MSILTSTIRLARPLCEDITQTPLGDLYSTFESRWLIMEDSLYYDLTTIVE
jgi:hypothetical protein